MGTAARIAWSHSRSSLLQTCPRAFYWEYFPWDEEAQDEAWFLKRVTNLPMLVGTHVHDAIDTAIRQIQLTRSRPNMEVLATHQIRNFARDTASSVYAVKRLRAGCKPPDGIPVLSEHLYGGVEHRRFVDCEEQISEHIKAFAASEIWDRITQISPKSIIHVNDSIITKPFFETTPALGFSPDLNVRVYAAIDLALLWEGDLVIFDWKTGWPTKEGLRRAKEQLSIYALWAWTAKEPKWSRILLQDVWLRGPCNWNPYQATLRNAISPAIGLLNEQLGKEMKRVKLDSVSSRYTAQIEEFPPKPSIKRCSGCKFRALCPEGIEKLK